MKKKSTWTNLKLQQKLVQFEFICGFAETYLAKFILAVHPAQNPKILHLPPSMTKKKLQILLIKHLETAKKKKDLTQLTKFFDWLLNCQLIIAATATCWCKWIEKKHFCYCVSSRFTSNYENDWTRSWPRIMLPGRDYRVWAADVRMVSASPFDS